MSGVRLNDIGMLLLFWLVPVLACIFYYGFWKRRRALEQFVEAGLLSRISV